MIWRMVGTNGPKGIANSKNKEAARHVNGTEWTDATSVTHKAVTQ